MVGQHHRFNGHELGQTPEDSEGQGGLVCYSPWGHDLAAEQQQQKFNSSVTLTTVHVLKTAIHGQWFFYQTAQIENTFTTAESSTG